LIFIFSKCILNIKYYKVNYNILKLMSPGDIYYKYIINKEYVLFLYYNKKNGESKTN